MRLSVVRVYEQGRKLNERELRNAEGVVGDVRIPIVQKLHLADYRARFGVVERRDLLELVGAMELTDEQTHLLKDGMQLLACYLGAVRTGWEDENAPIH